MWDMANLQQIVLGFDFSSNKIGIATGQTLTNTANALQTVVSPQKKINWSKIDEIVSQWSPHLFVVGLPLDLEGKEQSSSIKARDFADKLKQRYQLDVYFMDERFSSREASHFLGYDGHTSPRRESRVGKKIKKQQRNGELIDSVAAQLILQSWLNEQQ